jgi:predicted DNA-binding mobile mystery protein A
MKRPRRSVQSRSHLDDRMRKTLSPQHLAVPLGGWIKAVRFALGLTTRQLAERLGVKQPSVVALEQSEARGSMELATLRRAAAAMNCTVVYALIPNKPLEEMVRDGARAYARKRRGPIEHSMLLEDQAVTDKDLEAEIDQIIRETNPRLFWD